MQQKYPWIKPYFCPQLIINRVAFERRVPIFHCVDSRISAALDWRLISLYALTFVLLLDDCSTLAPAQLDI